MLDNADNIVAGSGFGEDAIITETFDSPDGDRKVFESRSTGRRKRDSGTSDADDILEQSKYLIDFVISCFSVSLML